MSGEEDSTFRDLEHAQISQALRIFLQHSDTAKEIKSVLWNMVDDDAGPPSPEGWQALIKSVRAKPPLPNVKHPPLIRTLSAPDRKR